MRPPSVASSATVRKSTSASVLAWKKAIGEMKSQAAAQLLYVCHRLLPQ